MLHAVRAALGAESGRSPRLHGLRDGSAKAAVHRAVKPKNAAICLPVATSPGSPILRRLPMSSSELDPKWLSGSRPITDIDPD